MLDYRADFSISLSTPPDSRADQDQTYLDLIFRSRDPRSSIGGHVVVVHQIASEERNLYDLFSIFSWEKKGKTADDGSAHAAFRSVSVPSVSRPNRIARLA